MPATDFASSVQGVRLRITPLQESGAVVASGHVLTTTGFITLSFSPEYEDGEEINERAANGQTCISWRGPDTLTRVSASLSVCSPDPEVTAMLAGGEVLWDPPSGGTGEIIGYAAPEVGGTLGNPVALEVWSYANIGGKADATLPYWRWVLPYAKMRFEGDREFTNGALANEFSGWSVGNAALTLADWTVGGLDRPFAYIRTDELPAVGWSGTPLTPPA